MDKIFLGKLYQITQVPVALYREDTLVFQMPMEYEPVFDQEKSSLQEVAESTSELWEPVIILENERIGYGAVRDENEIAIWGPISRSPVDKSLKSEYGRVHHLKKEAVICRMEIKDLKEILSLIVYEAGGKDIPWKNIRIITTNEDVIKWPLEKAEEEYLLEKSEMERDHDSLDYEKRLLEIVRTGDVERMEKMLHGNDTLGAEHIGSVAVKASKQAEYLSVALITLVARAAAEGGMDQERAYGRADVYLQRLEQCKTSEEMYALAARAQYEYTRGVQEARKKASRFCYVEQCKSYIAQNLRRAFTVEDIANTLGMNRTYLTKRFSETEGISIHRYIMKERCDHAANMLKYSDYPIALIGEYFCFSSQSHFGKVFHEFYGMTPKEYRNLNKR